MPMDVQAALERAWENRTALRARIEKEGTDCYRLFTGEPEGVAGLVVECFGPVAFLQKHLGQCRLTDGELAGVGRWVMDRTGVSSVYLKPFVTDRSHRVPDESLYSPTPFAGEPAPEVVDIRENSLHFGIRPYGGFSVGLFLDQRANRRQVAQGRHGRRVLNTFAYTCGFSVAAAKAGATVTSVDLSKKVLNWGRDNFVRNGLAPADHEFFAEDTFRFLKRAVSKGRRFDLVILDPPSFSRGESGVFSVRKDAEKLVRLAAEAVAPGGELFFSSNLSGWTSSDVRQRVESALKGARSVRQLTIPPPPEDFERSPGISCAWVQLS